ncbi:MAG TPA: hypothetical protein VFS45_02170 [Sphingomicrobium sp.]|nr:hypothetical protein [Sphingomicrobium sp.]
MSAIDRLRSLGSGLCLPYISGVTMTGWVEGIVSILRCEGCSQSTPHLTLSGDTDMTTTGLVSLSSVARDEIVVVKLEPAEFADDTGLAVQTRLNSLLERDDLRFVRLRRADAAAPTGGISFQDFQKAYQPPRLIFACPKCDVGDASQLTSETPSSYKRGGGKLTVLAGIDLRD